MNIFRFLGDMSHLLSFVLLYEKIHRTRSCKGQLICPQSVAPQQVHAASIRLLSKLMGSTAASTRGMH